MTRKTKTDTIEMLVEKAVATAKSKTVADSIKYQFQNEFDNLVRNVFKQ